MPRVGSATAPEMTNILARQLSDGDQLTRRPAAFSINADVDYQLGGVDHGEQSCRRGPLPRTTLPRAEPLS